METHKPPAPPKLVDDAVLESLDLNDVVQLPGHVGFVPIATGSSANVPTVVYHDERKLRVTQAAAAIGVHKRTLYGWIKRGLVETQRLPNGTMVVVMASIYRPMEGGAHGEQGR
jgi:hypothetical protein